MIINLTLEYATTRTILMEAYEYDRLGTSSALADSIYDL